MSLKVSCLPGFLYHLCLRIHHILSLRLQLWHGDWCSQSGESASGVVEITEVVITATFF